MENLNDAEFGSDDKGKEAPILIAQRYLNIFRQVHIFNKAKRDEFDEELLALPQDIINMIRKMPGGQLLVRHLEDVKTEKGIAFVKSNDDDLSSAPIETAETPMAAPQQIVGGSMVIDASFAETLAKSLAKAFKQFPAASPIAAEAALPAGMASTFEVISKEIQTTRASFQDLLKETRSITDSVIASQVSISRILEGILSSRKRDEIDLTNLNNRIIASQASITKLLEGLYNTTQNKAVAVSGGNIDIENRLYQLKNEINQEIERSVQRALKKFAAEYTVAAADRNASEAKENFATPSEPVSYHFIEDENNQFNDPIHFSPVSIPSVEEDSSLEQNFNTPKKKKKKKKKNKAALGEGAIVAGISEIPSIAKAEENIEEPINVELTKEDEETLQSPIDAFDGVIRNSAYPHEDDFSHINLDEPPLGENSEDTLGVDDFSIDEPTEIEESTPEAPAVDTADSFSGLDDLATEGLDFELPQEEPVEIEESTPEAPAVDTDDSFDGLDDFTTEGLDFELPQEEPAEIEESVPEAPAADTDDSFSGLDDFTTEGLDFELPQEEEPVEIEESAPEAPAVDTDDSFSGLDDFTTEGLDFELPQEEEPAEIEESAPEAPAADTDDSFSGLDNFTTEGLDFELPQEEEPAEIEESAPEAPAADTDDSFSGLDSFNSLDDLASIAPSQTAEKPEQLSNAPASPATTSRYSAELDRIRQALTSDNVDISSLDEPIALDDYQDDEKFMNDEEDNYSSDTFDNSLDSLQTTSVSEAQPLTDTENSSEESSSDEGEWEWEYVDENGNPIQDDEGGEDWEWEYVEEEENQNPDNNP